MNDKKDPKHGGQLDRRGFIVGSASLALVAGAGLARCSDDGGQPDGPTDASPDRLGKDLPREGAPSCSSPPTPLSPPSSPARVVEVHDAKSVSGTVYDAARIKAMVIAGIQRLANVTDTKQAWKALIPDFAASMRIGLKINTLNAQLNNSPEVLLALIDTLVNDLGADAQKIWVWDRRTDELTRAKLSQSVLKVKVAGTYASVTDMSGPGYEVKGVCAIDKQTRLSKILTAETDITINLGLLKTHNVSAITGALKNVYGCIDNPGEFHTDLNHYLPAIYRLDAMRKPLRLHITEGLRAVTKGDTTDYPDAVPGRLLFATDPVAIDVYAVKLVNSIRALNPKLKPLPTDKLVWIDEAAQLNLGTKTLDEQLVTMP